MILKENRNLKNVENNSRLIKPSKNVAFLYFFLKVARNVQLSLGFLSYQGKIIGFRNNLIIRKGILIMQ